MKGAVLLISRQNGEPVDARRYANIDTARAAAEVAVQRGYVVDLRPEGPAS